MRESFEYIKNRSKCKMQNLIVKTMPLEFKIISEKDFSQY